MPITRLPKQNIPPTLFGTPGSQPRNYQSRLGAGVGGQVTGPQMPWWLRGLQPVPLTGAPVGAFRGSGVDATAGAQGAHTVGGAMRPTGYARAGQMPYLPVVVKPVPVTMPAYNSGAGYGWGQAAPSPMMNAFDAQAMMNLAGQPPTAGAAGPGDYQMPRQGGAGVAPGKQYIEAPESLQVRGMGQWYRDFQDQHGGQIPEEFYGATTRGDKPAPEGLAEAIDDLNWSQWHERETGAPPTDREWQQHWYETRTGRPGAWVNYSEADRAAFKSKRERSAHKWRKKADIRAGNRPGRRENMRLWEGGAQYEGRGLNVLSGLKWSDYAGLDYDDQNNLQWLASISQDNEPVRWKDWLKLSDDQKWELAEASPKASKGRKFWGYDSLRIAKSAKVPEGYERPPKWKPPRVYWNV